MRKYTTTERCIILTEDEVVNALIKLLAVQLPDHDGDVILLASTGDGFRRLSELKLTTSLCTKTGDE
jgi:hypothetical protein